MKVQTFQLAREILSGQWLISYPERMMRLAMDYLSRTPINIDASQIKSEVYTDESGGADSESKKNKVMIVPLHGLMTKYETCESYGTIYLARSLKAIADDPTVVGVVLDIDSGGGATSSVAPVKEAIAYIKSSGKPIFAHVDTCGSAAYWVATQCDAIYMDNPLSQVGSVGVMMCIVDNSATNPQTGEKDIVIYAKESSDKNLSYRQALAGKYELAQDEMSPIVKHFQDDVIAGRPSLKKGEKGVLTGGMFLTDAALSLGMADAMHTLSETAEAVFAVADIS